MALKDRASSANPITVGSDKVYLEGERVVIYTANPMHWPVREFSRVPIYFQDRCYYLRSKGKAEPPNAMRFELWPWPVEYSAPSVRTIIYDSAYVAERDVSLRRERRNNILYAVLIAFYPLLGLCWSRFKRSVLSAVGFEPTSLTKASVALVFNVCVAQGILVGWLRSGLCMLLLHNSSALWMDWVLLLLLAADTVVRFDGILKSETEYHLGFCEWLKPGNGNLV
jgi:hypothetical protein